MTQIQFFFDCWSLFFACVYLCNFCRNYFILLL